MAERGALEAGGRQVEVHGAAHRDEERAGGGAREQAQDQEHPAPELSVVVDRRPELRGAGQEAEVRLHDVGDEAVEAVLNICVYVCMCVCVYVCMCVHT